MEEQTVQKIDREIAIMETFLRSRLESERVRIKHFDTKIHTVKSEYWRVVIFMTIWTRGKIEDTWLELSSSHPLEFFLPFPLIAGKAIAIINEMEKLYYKVDKIFEDR